VKPTLFFLHIPKTGGMTLNRIATAQYQPEQLFLIDNGRITAHFEEFKTWTRERKEKIQFVSGHMQYSNQQKHFPQNIKFTTVVRDPVDRIVSLFFYIKREPVHTLYHKVNEIITNMGAEEALRHYVFDMKRRDTYNAMTKQISGEKVAFGEDSREIYEKSIENIEKDFISVGNLKHYNKYLDFFTKNYKWRIGNIKRENTGKNKQKIPKKLLDEIRELNYYDQKLYEYIGKGIYE